MPGPAQGISDFVRKARQIQSASDFNVFAREYWFVWFTASLIILLMVLLNIGLCIFFQQRKKPTRNVLNKLKKPNKEPKTSKLNWVIALEKNISAPMYSIIIASKKSYVMVKTRIRV
jgi:hypothetical protein